MASLRLPVRLAAMPLRCLRPLSTTSRAFAHDKVPKTTEDHRSNQIDKPLNPSIPNKTPTLDTPMPSIGADNPPPEFLSSVESDYKSPNAEEELDVGEMEGAKFKVEPLRRTGEDANTMRARLLYQSRKRGTLESDLLLSTFADAQLANMTPAQLQQFDLFLDENDWDIYYWATQEPSPTSRETAEGSGPDQATPAAQGRDITQPPETDAWRQGQPRSGEWAQTVGTFKPAYRPVPLRWKNSEILALLRKHVIERSAGGVHEGDTETAAASESREKTGGGLGRMPDVQNFDV